MKTVLRAVCSIAIVVIMGTAVFAGQGETLPLAAHDYGISAGPVACGSANAVNPMFAASYGLQCFTGGKFAGVCPQNRPYRNVFKNTCYSTLQACSTSAGDAKGGACVLCSN